MSIELEAQGMHVTAYSDVVATRIGRAGATVESLSTFTPYRIDELESHLETITSRIDPAKVQ